MAATRALATPASDSEKRSGGATPHIGTAPIWLLWFRLAQKTLSRRRSELVTARWTARRVSLSWKRPLTLGDLLLPTMLRGHHMTISFLTRLIKRRPAPQELPPGLFDTDFYLHNNPDVRDTGLTAWEHYRTIGATQNRKPRADFDSLYYSSTHVDVVAGGIDPFLHYVRQGWAEGRTAVPPPPQPARYQLRNIVVGGTNVCNASCVHCPTNKPLTAHLGQGAMSQSTFERIVDQIADRCDIHGWASFGLYGDGLVDPLLVERASYFRKKIPHLTLSVATNGAAYSRIKHARLPDILDGITVHVESVSPAKYNTLMAPLRFENVSIKLEQIVEDFRGKVFIAIPWHRANHDQRQEIVDYFLARGVREVNFIGLSNRCSMHKEFDSLHSRRTLIHVARISWLT
jgi:sulfatase maturation enzyme AslB (radical SAM superfamily)